MVPLDKAVAASYRLLIVTMSPSGLAAVFNGMFQGINGRN